MSNPDPTEEYINERLDLTTDPVRMFWKAGSRKGKEAGCKHIEHPNGGGGTWARSNSRTVWTIRMDGYQYGRSTLRLLGSGKPRPGPGWTGDHLNRDALDDRLENLKWKTPSGQNLNRDSSAHYGPTKLTILKTPTINRRI